jgi:hypothetical protein
VPVVILSFRCDLSVLWGIRLLLIRMVDLTVVIADPRFSCHTPQQEGKSDRQEGECEVWGTVEDENGTTPPNLFWVEKLSLHVKSTHRTVKNHTSAFDDISNGACIDRSATPKSITCMSCMDMNNPIVPPPPSSTL